MKERVLINNIKTIPYSNKDMYSIFLHMIRYIKKLTSSDDVYSLVTVVVNNNKLAAHLEKNDVNYLTSLASDNFEHFSIRKFGDEKNIKEINKKIIETLNQNDSSYLYFTSKNVDRHDQDFSSSLKNNQLFRIVVNPQSEQKIEIFKDGS